MYVYWAMGFESASWWKWTPGGYVRVQRGPALGSSFLIGNDDTGYRYLAR